MTVNQIYKELPNYFCGDYGKRLFAWMMGKASNSYDQAVSDRKRSLFASLHGKVLEISPGTAPNLPYYPQDIHWIGIEPNPYMHSYLRQQAETLGLKADLRIGNAEWIDAEDNSIDAVVTTLVLCSVPNVAYTLQAILRVLKPGGRLLFIEHIAAPPQTLLRKIQTAISPIWQVLGDGWRLDRETWIALENAGFKSVNYDYFEAPFLLVSDQIIGVATK